MALGEVWLSGSPLGKMVEMAKPVVWVMEPAMALLQALPQVPVESREQSSLVKKSTVQQRKIDR